MQVTGSGRPLEEDYPQTKGLERFVYQVLRDLRCAPFLPGYMQAGPLLCGRCTSCLTLPCLPAKQWVSPPWAVQAAGGPMLAGSTAQRMGCPGSRPWGCCLDQGSPG